MHVSITLCTTRHWDAIINNLISKFDFFKKICYDVLLGMTNLFAIVEICFLL